MMTMSAALIRNIVLQQLTQDKLCQFKFNQTAEFCISISSKESDPIKNEILSEMSSYLSLKESVTVVPVIILALFSGSWCDRFVNGRRYVLLIYLIGQILETALLLLNSIFYAQWDFRLILLSGIPTAMTGNGLIIACCSFITATTNEKDRPVRFLIYEAFYCTGLILGFVAGPRIMGMKPFLLPGIGLHSYTEVLFVALLLLILTFIWSYFRVTSNTCLMLHQKESPEAHEVNHNVVGGDELSQSTSSSSYGDTQTSSSPDKKTSKRREKSFVTRCRAGMSSIFALQDLRDIWQTLTRKRPGSHRAYMWTMIIVHATVLIPIIGSMYVAYPLMQLLYHWDSQRYGVMMAMAMGVRPIAIGLYTSLIVKRFKMSELQLVIVGLVSCVLSLIFIGSITNEYGFYTEAIISSLTGTALSGNRSFLSLIIPSNEIAKVFAIFQIVDSLLPFAASVFMSSIFSATIAFYPTMMYHCCAFVLIFSIAAVAYIDVKRLSNDQKE
jgi:hypothetical protein